MIEESIDRLLISTTINKLFSVNRSLNESEINANGVRLKFQTIGKPSEVS